MQERLIAMYQTRLQGLENTIINLHNIIDTDQALRLMDQPQLIQYRIDRINQIVRDVLQSQKEQVIIHLLNKVEELQQQSNQHPKTPMIPVKQQESSVKEQYAALKEQLAFQRHTSYSLKLQLQQELQSLQKDTKEKERIIQDLQLELQETIKKKDEGLRQEKKQLQIILKKVELERKEVEEMKLQLAKDRQLLTQNNPSPQKQQTIRIKLERMQKLKKEMYLLSQQLTSNKQMISTLKTNLRTFLHHELQLLRQDCQGIKSYVIRCVQELKQQDQPEESLLSRMVKLQNAMGQFIQRQGLTRSQQ